MRVPALSLAATDWHPVTPSPAPSTLPCVALLAKRSKALRFGGTKLLVDVLLLGLCPQSWAPGFLGLRDGSCPRSLQGIKRVVPRY